MYVNITDIRILQQEKTHQHVQDTLTIPVHTDIADIPT